MIVYDLRGLLHAGSLRIWRRGAGSQMATVDYDRAIIASCDGRFRVVRPLPLPHSDGLWIARLEDVAAFDTLTAAIAYVATEHGVAPEFVGS